MWFAEWGAATGTNLFGDLLSPVGQIVLLHDVGRDELPAKRDLWLFFGRFSTGRHYRPGANQGTGPRRPAGPTLPMAGR